MRGHVINFAEAKRINQATFDAWTTRLKPRAGDLLLAREAPVGPVVRIPVTENVAPGQRTVLLRADPEKVESNFLYYYLTSPSMQANLQVKASGSTLPHLNVADVRDLPTPGVPSLVDQRAIVEVLEALNNKIAANDRMLVVADELNAAEVLASLAVDPVSLREVATLHYGKSLPAAQRIAGDVVVIGSGGPSGVHNSALVDRAGVVVGRKGTIGAVHWVDGPHFPIDTTYFVEPAAGYTPEVLYYILKSAGLRDLNSDSAVPGLNRETAYSQLLRVPNGIAAEVLARRLPDRFALMAAVRSESAVTGRTRDELLPLLMSGKVRIMDVEGVA